jgi:hypothetical protein
MPCGTTSPITGLAMTECYLEHHYDSLDEFWNAVSPIGEVFGKSTSNFIFRGHRDSDWGLIPQVYRKDIIDRYKTGMAGVLETCYRYRAKRCAENSVIAEWLVTLPRNQRNWGFGLCFLYLRNVKGFAWNHMR